MATGSGSSHMAGTRANSRIIGIDVARGIALASMLTVHVFNSFNSDGSPTIATEFFSGKGPAVFAVMAGLSLVLVTGGRHPIKDGRLAASAGLAVRALLICLVGLSLGYATANSGVYMILPYYAVMFLLAIPLLGLGPRVLAAIAVVLAIVAQPLLDVTVGTVPNPASSVDVNANGTLGTAVHHPVGLLILLLFGGAYPSVLWMAYICAGMALGRLDLT